MDIEEKIIKYFENLSFFSYSLYQDSKNVLRFLRKRILKIEKKTPAMMRGIRYHSNLAFRIQKGETEVISILEKRFGKPKEVQSEMEVKERVKELFEIDIGFHFLGRIDVVLRYPKKTIILDYKTGKSKDEMQLSIYSVIAEKKWGHPCETYFLDSTFNILKAKRKSIDPFLTQMTKVWKWKKDPSLFIEELERKYPWIRKKFSRNG